MSRLLKILGTVLVIGPLLTVASHAQEEGKSCANPTSPRGFKTCADISKAVSEGQFVLYTSDPEEATTGLLQAFNKVFPEIKTSFIRLQGGALHAKIVAELQANNVYADAIIQPDTTLGVDLQQKKGYSLYVSPESAAYKAEYKSTPEGYYTWGAITFAGIAYNPKVVSPSEAPKSWHDTLDPKWKDGMSVKTINSGQQHVTWYVLKMLYGEDFFTQFAKQQPRAFDSSIQQYTRLINGQDKLATSAQYSIFLQYKEKDAPLEMVFPSEGVTATAELVGLLEKSPHPNAGKLFLDWFLSPLGQKANVELFGLMSPRSDVAPPKGSVSLDSVKLLFPKDWLDYNLTKVQFNREWGKVLGR